MILTVKFNPKTKKFQIPQIDKRWRTSWAALNAVSNKFGEGVKLSAGYMNTEKGNFVPITVDTHKMVFDFGRQPRSVQ